MVFNLTSISEACGQCSYGSLLLKLGSYSNYNIVAVSEIGLKQAAAIGNLFRDLTSGLNVVPVIVTSLRH